MHAILKLCQKILSEKSIISCLKDIIYYLKLFVSIQANKKGEKETVKDLNCARIISLNALILHIRLNKIDVRKYINYCTILLKL